MHLRKLATYLALSITTTIVIRVAIGSLLAIFRPEVNLEPVNNPNIGETLFHIMEYGGFGVIAALSAWHLGAKAITVVWGTLLSYPASFFKHFVLIVLTGQMDCGMMGPQEPCLQSIEMVEVHFATVVFAGLAALLPILIDRLTIKFR